MNIEKEDLYIFGVILSRYENPSYHEKKFINKYKKLIIKKPVETTNEQPKKKTFYYTTCRECGGKCKAPNEICNKCFKEWGGY